jgi:hypothetical protein
MASTDFSEPPKGEKNGELRGERTQEKRFILTFEI